MTANDSSLLTLLDATDLFPKPDGQKVSLATLYRWSRRGVRDVTLETVKVGRTRYTTRAAVRAFIRRLVAAEGRHQGVHLGASGARHKAGEASERAAIRTLGI